MRDIKLEIVGQIVSGEELGRFVKVVDDGSVSGGFLILIFDDPDRCGDVHDHWVESIVDVDQFFDELSWVIDWAPTPSRVGSECDASSLLTPDVGEVQPEDS